MTEDRYPSSPGFSRPGTSEDAAIAVGRRSRHLRDRVLIALRQAPRTADECASYMGEPYGTIRPRVSELQRMGLIEDTGERHKNESGKFAIVWRHKPQPSAMQ